MIVKWGVKVASRRSNGGTSVVSLEWSLLGPFGAEHSAVLMALSTESSGDPAQKIELAQLLCGFIWRGSQLAWHRLLDR